MPVSMENHHRLLGDGKRSCSPLSPPPHLGFAGFFFPLLKSMFGMRRNPPFRQQGFQGGGVARDDSPNPA